MSLMKTLARVAAGVVLAKGIGTMMKNNQQGRPTSQGRVERSTGGGILGDLLNQTRSGGSSSGGGLGDIFGQVLGGGAAAGTAGSASRSGGGRPYGGPNSPSGGLGGILDNLTRNAGGATSGSVPRTGQSSGGGGLGDILGGLAGAGAAGGLGGVLGDLLGGGQAQAGQPSVRGGLAQRDSQPQNDASFGQVLNEALRNGGEPETKPTPQQNAVAGLLLSAMIQAAKSDGRIDEQEKARLLGQMGDLDEEEQQFIREQMAAPVDPQALARDVPQGLQSQVYLVSLMAIDFDNQSEAQYLHGLAQALGLGEQQVNAIHEQVGVQNLYA